MRTRYQSSFYSTYKDAIWMCSLIASILVVVAAVIVVSWHMESKTYNRLTGAHTTWTDAVWVELKVYRAIEQPAESNEH